MHLRDLLDVLHGLVGDLIGLAELALHHDEDRLHPALPYAASAFFLGGGGSFTGLRRKSGM